MGWRLIAGTFVVLAVCSTVIIAGYGSGESGLAIGLRFTARVSLGLFVLTFVASSLNALWKGSVGKALLRNRTYLGLSFAVAHFIHLGFIAGRVFGHSGPFWSERTPASLVPGGIAYLFLLAMVVTSFAGPKKRLGRTKWKILHKAGMYVLFGIFMAASLKNLKNDPLYAIHVSVLGLALAVRAAARLRRRSKARVS